MMTRTRWYPSQITPVRSGVYQILLSPTGYTRQWPPQPLLAYAHWSDEGWGLWAEEIHLALPGNSHIRYPWRGLRHNPYDLEIVRLDGLDPVTSQHMSQLGATGVSSALQRYIDARG